MKTVHTDTRHPSQLLLVIGYTVAIMGTVFNHNLWADHKPKKDTPKRVL